MATQTAPAPKIAEETLRDRIHRIFSGDVSPAETAGGSPAFWVGPTEDQKNALVLDLHERIALTDEVDLERHWLSSPHVGLGGKSPEELLTGDECSRKRLEVFLATFETAFKDSFR